MSNIIAHGGLLDKIVCFFRTLLANLWPYIGRFITKRSNFHIFGLFVPPILFKHIVTKALKSTESHRDL